MPHIDPLRPWIGHERGYIGRETISPEDFLNLGDLGAMPESGMTVPRAFSQRDQPGFTQFIPLGAGGGPPGVGGPMIPGETVLPANMLESQAAAILAQAKVPPPVPYQAQFGTDEPPMVNTASGITNLDNNWVPTGESVADVQKRTLQDPTLWGMGGPPGVGGPGGEQVAVRNQVTGMSGITRKSDLLKLDVANAKTRFYGLPGLDELFAPKEGIPSYGPMGEDFYAMTDGVPTFEQFGGGGAPPVTQPPVVRPTRIGTGPGFMEFGTGAVAPQGFTEGQLGMAVPGAVDPGTIPGWALENLHDYSRSGLMAGGPAVAGVDAQAAQPSVVDPSYSTLYAARGLGTEPGIGGVEVAEVIEEAGGAGGAGGEAGAADVVDPDAADRVLWNSYKAAGGGLSFLNWQAAGPTGPPDDKKVTTADDTTTEAGGQQQATGQPQTFAQFLEEQFQGVYNPPYGFMPNKELILDAWTNAGGTVTPEIDALYDQSRTAFMDRYPQLISDSVAVTDGAGTVASPEAGGPPMPPGMTGGPQLLGSGRDASTGMMPTVTGAASVPGAYQVTPAARPLPLWEEALGPEQSFRRFRMEQFPGLSLAGLKQAGQALGWGFDPAYGRFLLNQIATGIPGAVAGVTPGAAGVTGALGMAGVPVTPGAGTIAAPTLDEAMAGGLTAGGYEPLGRGSLFRQYLGTGQRRPLGDIRGTYAGLGDYLRASAGVGAGSIGADLTDIDPRYEMYLGGMDAGQLQQSILGMTQAALGVRPGMTGYVQPGLTSMYNRMSELYGPQGASRFADWISSAYQRPSYTPYTPTRYQQGIGTQLAPQIQSPYQTDYTGLAAGARQQQSDALSNALASGSLQQGDWDRYNFASGVDTIPYNPQLDLIR